MSFESSIRFARQVPFIALALTSLFAVGCNSTPYKEKVALLPVNSFSQQWVLPLNLSDRKDSIANLYLRDDVLFAYSSRNLVAAISAASGKGIFSAEITPDQVPLKPPVLVRDRYAFAGGTSIEIYSKAGKRLDLITTKASIRSGGVSLGDTLYYGLDYPNGGRMAAIDLTRQFDRSRWELMMYSRMGISASPAIYQNVIYVADESGAIYATGEERSPIWPLDHSVFQTDGAIVADLKSDEGAIYAACEDGKVYCVDATSGRLRWQYYATVPLTVAPVIAGDTVYQVMPKLGVAAIDKTQGKSNRDAKWIAKGATKFLSQDEKNAYFRDGNNHIMACNRATGEVVFRSKRDDLVAFAINTKTATIYASTKDGRVMAISPITLPGSVGTMVLAKPTAIDAIAMNFSMNK